MKNIKKLLAATFVFAGFVAQTGCDMARFAPEDCQVNSDYQIECGDFDPGLKPN